MLTELEIKEEPMDENDDQQQEMFNKQMRQSMQMELIKDEPEDVDSINGDDNFHIVEEHDQFITVSAADMKTQDELHFIEKLQTPQTTLTAKYSGACPKCLKTFDMESTLLEHTKRNNCIVKLKCPVCPLTFVNSPTLLKHLTLHRDNYFFCSQNCGANFETFALCESHEIQIHKTKTPQKIRYRHFCSYCREGFRTELQLHVHWLQQNQGCGKLMQDVALHASIASNDIPQKYNVNINNNEKDKLSTTPTQPTPPASLAITKLRLKSLLPATKRTTAQLVVDSSNNNDESHMKRTKFMNNLKTKMEMPDQFLCNFGTELQIKEEPVDDEDVMNTTPPLMPEVIIKAEDEKIEEIPAVEKQSNDINRIEMKSLLINGNKELNPDFLGKIIPLTVQSNMPRIPPLHRISSNNNNSNNKPNSNNNNKTNSCTNINNNNNNKTINNNNASNNNTTNIITNNATNLANNSLKNITNLKFVRLAPRPPATTPAPVANLLPTPPNIQIIPLQQQSQQLPQTDFKVIPAPKMSLQIIKLLPNTQFVTFRSEQQLQQQITGNKINNNCIQPTNIVKLQSGPYIGKLVQPPTTNFQIMKIGPAPAALMPTANGNTNMPDPTKPPVSITLTSSSLNTNPEFNKLQTGAIHQADEHRIQYISKKNLIAIESLPEKKHLIDTMKQQIAKVAPAGADTSLEKNSPSPPPLLKISKDITAPIKKAINEPDTLYLPIMSAIDVPLVEARYQFPDYVYKWICPYCQKDYDIKRCLKSHLSKAHNLTARDMDKINAQAKPYKNEEVTIEFDIPLKQEAEEILTNKCPNDDADDSTVQAQTSMNVSNTSTQPQPIKMSALKATKPRYMCEKCGRKCSSKIMLQDHVSSSCSREPQYRCTECPKKFYSSSTLQCHLTIHTGELPHKCSYCDKRFRTRGQVTVHHRTHTGERPFVCQVCSQRFTHRETLIAHLSRHIGMKRYKCYNCDKHFSCISALKTHREIRPDTCGKVKFNPRAVGPRVRVVRGNVIFEAQPEINPYLRSEDPKSVLAELQNQPESVN